MRQLRLAISVAFFALAGCTEPCPIPLESAPTTEIVRLKEGSLITYEATLTDSNIKIFKRPPWTERVLTFGASIGGKDSVIATESLEDLTMRFQDMDANSFYQYRPLGPAYDILKSGFWLRLPLGPDTLIQQVADTSSWGHIIVTYKSFFVGKSTQLIDGKNYSVDQIQTNFSWEDHELNNELVHHEFVMTTNVIRSLGIFSEQTLGYPNGRPRSHIIVKKIEL